MRHFTLLKGGLFASLPLWAEVVGDTVGGLATDWLLRRTGNVRLARSGVAITGLLGCAVFIVPAALTEDPYVAVGCLTAAMFFLECTIELSFGAYLADADSALSHLQHDVGAVHADVRNTIQMNAYSVNPAAVSALEKTMPKFNLPESTLTVQTVEGLPSLDAALGMEAILVPGENGNVSSTGSGTNIASGR